MNPTPRAAALSSRLQELWLHGQWIANTNYAEQLYNTSWRQAIQSPKGLNSVAALTFHINYYIAGILPVFAGGALTITDQFSFPQPPIATEQDWNQLRKAFFDNARLFIQQVAAMTDEQLDAVFVKEQYGTWQRNIEAMLEHSYYHLGQIVLIRKWIATPGIK